MKHGSLKEIHGKRKYKRLMRRQHKWLSTRDSGQFISGSPDLVMCWACHGKGPCEVKYPYEICNQKSTYLDYLNHFMNVNGKSKRSPKLEHYYQVQIQMACTSTQYCDYFVLGR